MNALRIGIRDSGVGGLTVARRIREQIPGADLLYFADTAHVPYGEKSAGQILHYALSISEFLIAQGAQIVVFACNTTSALALDAARARFEVPVFGVIEPGARAVAQVSRGKVGVLATSATVASGIYRREISRLRPELEILEIACPDFVPLVEARQTDSQRALEACQNYLQPLLDFGADTVVLGCTHYPLLLAPLQTVAPHIRFVDPADTLACQISAHLGQAITLEGISTKNESATSAQEPRDTFWVSGARDGLEDWIRTLLQAEKLHLKTGPVFDL